MYTLRKLYHRPLQQKMETLACRQFDGFMTAISPISQIIS